jgi:hypothetical protein
MNKRKRILSSVVLGFLAAVAASCESDQSSSIGAVSGLELSGYKLNLVYEDKFSKPLSLRHEEELFRGNERVKRPRNVDWVLEGMGSAWTENGRLHVSNTPQDDATAEPHDVVLWNTRTFPANFLLEFAFSPQNSRKGLAIIFFSARGRDGGSIFDLDQPMRSGIYSNYHSGGIDAYHASYWAVQPNGEPRKSSHLRKSYGFDLVAEGDDNIWNQGSGPHKVRLLKVNGDIQLETRGEVVLSWHDDGRVLGKGYIGLRTMAHTGKASYADFKVWRVTD